MPRTVGDDGADRRAGLGHDAPAPSSWPLPIDEMEHQPPAERQVVPMAETASEHQQALGHAAGQTGQGHGLGRLADT
jgi:hypothetical protein